MFWLCVDNNTGRLNMSSYMCDAEYGAELHVYYAARLLRAQPIEWFIKATATCINRCGATSRMSLNSPAS